MHITWPDVAMVLLLGLFSAFGGWGWARIQRAREEKQKEEMKEWWKKEGNKTEGRK